MTLYNIRNDSSGSFTIAKFDDDCNFEVAYTVSADLKSCTCPAGPRPSCKHRKMVPRMQHQLGSGWFYNYETQKWHRPVGEVETASTVFSGEEGTCPECGYIDCICKDETIADAVGSEHHPTPYGRNPMMDELPAIKAENESRLEELRQREAALAKPATAVQGIRRRA